MKNTLAVLSATLLLVSLLLAGCSKEPANDDPYADIPETSVEEFKLALKEDYVGIMGYFGTSKIVKIPSEIEGRPVTVILHGAFMNTDIEMVILPDSITEIRTSAFKGCKQLREVHFSKNLSIIQHEAFRNCTSLEKVILPDSLLELQTYVFAECVSLAEVQINGGDLTIDEFAFSENKSLKKIIMNGVKHIGLGAFAGSSQLESVIFPETVETIESIAFSHCSKLTDVIFRGDLPTMIDESTFKSTETVTLYYKKGAAGTDNPKLSVYILKEYE